MGQITVPSGIIFLGIILIAREADEAMCKFRVFEKNARDVGSLL